MTLSVLEKKEDMIIEGEEHLISGEDTLVQARITFGSFLDLSLLLEG